MRYVRWKRLLLKIERAFIPTEAEAGFVRNELPALVLVGIAVLLAGLLVLRATGVATYFPSW